MHALLQQRTTLESPRWHGGRFWVSDVFARQVLAVSLDGVVAQALALDEHPSGLGWLPDGRLLVVSYERDRLLRVEADGRVAVHADLAGLASGHPNDLLVDAAGRAFVGISGFDFEQGEALRPGVIARVDPDGRTEVVADDLLYPNGMVLLADGVTLVVSESFGQRLTAFTLQADGTLGQRRPWATFGPPCGGDVEAFVAAGAVLPDGLCADADGCLWVADAVAGRALRVREGGEIAEVLAGPPGHALFACMLGGDDGRTLALCTCAHMDPHTAVADPTAQLLLTPVTSAHAGCP